MMKFRTPDSISPFTPTTHADMYRAMATAVVT